MASKNPNLRRNRILKLSAVLSILAMAIFIVIKVDDMLVSFIFAFVTNYLLSPIANFLERRGVPRTTSILIPFLASGFLIFLGFYAVVPLIITQVRSLAVEAPKYQTDLSHFLSVVELRLEQMMHVKNLDLTSKINQWVLSKSGDVSAGLPGLVSHSLTVMLLTPLFGFFMMRDGHTLARRLLMLVPNNIFELALFLQYRINEQLGGFIRARFLEAAIVGLVVWIGLFALGFPYAALLALLAAFTNLIPYLGPVLGAAPAVLIALISADGQVLTPWSLNVAAVVIVYLFAQAIDMFLIIPFVVAKIVNLHPVTVVVVIIIGAQAMGILGMVISIPVASVLKVTLSALYDHLLEDPSGRV